MRKICLLAGVFLLVGAVVFFAGSMLDDSVGPPRVVASDSPCPATSCASGQCHGFDNVPDADGIHEMSCPEVTCASVECHAWDSLTTRYYRPSDASMNLWLVVPVVLIVGLVLLVKRVK